jgi:hypothetical protein
VTDPDPRVAVNLRLRRSSRDRVDTIAELHDWDRATALRTLLVLGLRAWDRGERP